MARIGRQNKCCVPSGQRWGTYVCSDSQETLGAWLGSFNPSTIQSRPGTKRLPLFLALQNFLSDKILESRGNCENRLLEFFTNKDQDFYDRGLMQLPLKWQQIIQ
ncbi:hypothetical protein TNCV_1510721 [Trichonephila clavipes]|nr:hypothetical protein TNCV_1510721 [Trichonephila clavipes]